MKHEELIKIQRKSLAAWLQIWQLSLKLEAAADPAAGSAGETAFKAYPLTPRPVSAKTVPRLENPDLLLAGAIMLLPPTNEITRTRPVYVALVEAVQNDHWLVVPFGRFPLPAVPGEIATSRQAVPLKVLCIWNSARLDAQHLAQGWQVGQLNRQERRWVAQLLDLPAGQNPPEALALRLGPPLIHPLDPRHDYLEQERMLWFQDKNVNCRDEASTSYKLKLDDELPCAAEKSAPYHDKS